MHFEKDFDKFYKYCETYIFSDASLDYFQFSQKKISFVLDCWSKSCDLEVVLHYKIQGIEHSICMKAQRDQWSQSFKKNIPARSDRVSWYFEIFNNSFVVYYSNEGLSPHIPSRSRHFSHYLDPTYPKWMLKSVIYQVFVDRYHRGSHDFRNQDNKKIIYKDFKETPDTYQKSKCMDFYGGNLVGLGEKVPYLKDLGISLLYLNPIFDAKTHHGY
ncbi:alpha-amylase family glycosyl hydrolase, partial [bacterium]|nr:alpha-amylase family glycosyl hydrolase [bacterium]